MEEIWKDCICYEDIYEISNYGVIRSKNRYVKCNAGIKLVPSQLLKPSERRGGYQANILYGWGLRINFYLHRLVWETFKGGIPLNLEVNHIDGNKKNNFIMNLELVTTSENQLHARKVGLAKTKFGHRGSGLTEMDVICILALSCKGIQRKELAQKYKVNPSYITQIVTGQAWQYLLRPIQYERKNLAKLQQRPQTKT